ncbi:MAG: polysaccharide lyase family protein [Tepidisphaeraceae bacterium]
MIFRFALCAAITIASASVTLADSDSPVSVRESSSSFVLDNGIVTATIEKKSGNLQSLIFNGKELLATGPNAAPGRWYYTPQTQYPTEARVTIDPSGNSGQRAEVEVAGIYSQTADPGTGAPSSFVKPTIRYSLGRGDKGIYTYELLAIHESVSATFPPFNGSYVLRLDHQLFDHLTAGKNISRDMPSMQEWLAGKPTNIPEARAIQTGRDQGQVECKYDYDVRPIDAPSFGWTDTKDQIGIWVINPSTEYICNPLRVVSTGWIADQSGVPILANFWGVQNMAGDDLGLYQGPRSALGDDVDWSKVIGPFLIYCNSGSFDDALVQQKTEASQWPYSWVQMKGYLPREKRWTITGQIALDDPKQTIQWGGGFNATPGQWAAAANPPPANQGLKNLLVGLTTPAPDGWEWDDWQSDVGSGEQSPFVNYQYWARSDDGVHFSIPNVPPGTYTLHAIADGVLGEMTIQNLKIDPPSGQADAQSSFDLGKKVWKPLRLGPELFQIGTPDRTGDKFWHGGDYRHWGLYTLYPNEFPRDVNFTAESSDEAKNWNYQQPLGTTWTIHFAVGYVPPPPQQQVQTPMPGYSMVTQNTVTGGRPGRAGGMPSNSAFSVGMGNSNSAPAGSFYPPSHLWIAFANNAGMQFAGQSRLAVAVNGTAAETTQADFHPDNSGPPPTSYDDKSVARDGIQGIWSAEVFTFPSEVLHGGDNIVTLRAVTPSGGPANQPHGGIIYDSLRMDLGNYPGLGPFIVQPSNANP